MTMFLAALALLACVAAEQQYQVFYRADTKNFFLQPPFPGAPATTAVESDVLVASGVFANDTSKTGWYTLSVEGEKGAADSLMMGGAGYFEGVASSSLIDIAIANYAMDTSNKTLMDDLRWAVCCVLVEYAPECCDWV